MAAPKKSRKSPRAQVSLVARYRSPTAFEFVQEECFDLSLGRDVHPFAGARARRAR